MRVALCIIATNKYQQFLPDLLTTASEFFCRGHEVRFFVFSDAGIVPLYHDDAILVPTPHEPWPGPTLHRYRIMLKAEKELAIYDYIFYVDVDSRFVRPVGQEIFGELVGTIHYGYAGRTIRQMEDKEYRWGWLYELRRESRAYVPVDDGTYYAGGFQGGESKRFLAAMREMDEAIADDEQRGIVARWHDESHWNAYLVAHPPDLALSHDYMCPEQWRPDTQRICIVGKNPGEWHR